MDDGRLGIVRKRENIHRKYVYIVNDVIKSKWDVLDGHIAREKVQLSLDWDKSTMLVRRAIIRQRVLKQCMKMRREGVAHHPKERILGHYGGKSIHAFSRDIDKQIADNHPRLRRLRKVRKQISESLEKGNILKPTEISRRMKNYFEKHFKEEKVERKPPQEEEIDDDIPKKDIFSRQKGVLPPIRGLVNTFYKFVREDETKATAADEENSGQKTFDRLGLENDKDVNKHTPLPKIRDGFQDGKTSRTPSPVKSKPLLRDPTLRLERKRSLILPPINITKDTVDKISRA